MIRRQNGDFRGALELHRPDLHGEALSFGARPADQFRMAKLRVFVHPHPIGRVVDVQNGIALSRRPIAQSRGQGGARRSSS